MQDGEPVEHGFISPWFLKELKPAGDYDYFPNDYPIDERLVTPPSEQDKDHSN